MAKLFNGMVKPDISTTNNKAKYSERALITGGGEVSVKSGEPTPLELTLSMLMFRSMSLLGGPSSPLRVGYLTRPYLSHLVRPAPWWCALLVLRLCSGFATAQQNITQPPPTPTPQFRLQAIPTDLLKEEIPASKEIKEKEGQFLMGNGLPETPQMLAAREEYTVYAWKNRKDAFAWQSISTKVIFVVVIIVVLAGLYLSWMQFNFAHKAPMKLTRQSTETPPIEQSPDKQVDPENTTIEVNTKGMKITSSVIGLVILALSIVFFFLYLKFVYSIVEV